MKTKIKLICNALALSKSKGFTLIELLVVVAIIGVLATVVMINVSGAKASSRYVKTVAEMSEIAKATLQYKAEHNGVWPQQWSGYLDWKDECDGCHATPPSLAHMFNNNPIDATYSAVPNEFLVDYMGGEKFKPECPNASYSFYDYTGYQILVYWPYDSGSISSIYPVGGTVPASYPRLLNKTTKQLKCGNLTQAQLEE